jgi:ribonuclease-3
MESFHYLIARLIRPRSHASSLTAGEIPPHPHFTKHLHEFEDLIGYRIRSKDLFIRALLHRSYLQQRQHVTKSNERMEFLGDSILNLIVAESLYHRYPKAEEGDLTKMRSRLVNRKALAAYARTIRLSEFILASPSAASGLGKGESTIAADTFEALIAAIYLDGGFHAAERFIEKRILGSMRSGDRATLDDNYKSMLLEYAQARGLGIPRYAILKEEGPDHDRTFTVEVSLSNGRKGMGTGKNKKEAEQAAAERALKNLT